MFGPGYRTGGGPEFSGEPTFAMGSVFGARHFRVREDGALTGVDGEEGYLDGTKMPEVVNQDWYADDHDFAACTCGWYAYLKGSMNYADDSNVAGVVEAFGLVRQGTRGFRAQKARIRALYVPPVSEASREYTYKAYDKDLPMPEAMRRAAERSRVASTMRVKIAARYPSIPMFTDLDEMLRAFPTDEPKEG